MNMQKNGQKKRQGLFRREAPTIAVLIVSVLFAITTYWLLQLRREGSLARLSVESEQIELCEKSGGFVMYVDFEGMMRPVKRADGSVVCEEK